MCRSFRKASCLAAATIGMLVSGANADEFHARFSGFNEVGALNAESGAILSNGRGTLDLNLDKKAQTLAFKLTYSNLSAQVTQAHIHFGKVHVPGGVIVFFCSNLGNGPPGTQTCPATGGTVTGTIIAANVVGPAAQNVSPGDFDALADAIASDTAYANIHTLKFPAGEIRAEVRRGADE
jgi:CHRD domain-containing protein